MVNQDINNHMLINLQRMPNPMGGMGGPKPCMMGGPHMGPRMMPGPNLNTMNGMYFCTYI